MATALATATALTWLWLGMVLAISFLEAPLKFRAPGVTVPIGLGIGRLVFRALNIIEAVLALAIVVCVLLTSSNTIWPVGAAALILLVQLVAVRPRLSRRTDAVLDGAPSTTRSHAHQAYVVLEIAKVAALITAGIMLLSVL